MEQMSGICACFSLDQIWYSAKMAFQGTKLGNLLLYCYDNVNTFVFVLCKRN